MKYYLNDVFLFYLPITCLFLLFPGVVSVWWKMTLAGPLLMIMVASVLLGIILNKKNKPSSLAQQEQQLLQKRDDSLKLQIHSEIVIGQSGSDSQFSSAASDGSFTVTLYELPCEGIAVVLCLLDNQKYQSFNESPFELLIDSGELWLYDSMIDESQNEFVLLHANDPTAKLIVDSDQQNRGAIFRLPYGDGGYKIWQNESGFLIECIPDAKNEWVTKSAMGFEKIVVPICENQN